MQAPGQYGVPDVSQYAVVGKVPAPHGHMFNLSHESMSLSPSSGHSHSHSHSPHTQHQHHQPNHTHHQQLHVQLPQHQQHVPQPPQAQQRQHGFAQQPQHQQPQQAQPAAQPQPLQQQQQHVESSEQPHGLGSDSTPEAAPALANRTFSNNNYSKVALVNVRDESLDGEDQDGLGEEGDKGSAGNRWPRQETVTLLSIRSDMDATFRDSTLKGPLWEEISRKMGEMGYHRSAKKCKEKFENVSKYYKRTKDGKGGRQDGKSYRFFSQLEALYGKSDHTGNRITAGLLTNGPSFRIGTNATPLKRTEAFVSTVGHARPIMHGTQERPSAKPGSDMSSGPNSSSDSSDDDFEDLEESEHPESKKRKRRSAKKLLFLESVMRKVLEKQEQMQQRFLDALERRDQDRMIREEAWKRQELARLSREHDLQAQERALSASRDAALITFLQKFTGQILQLPQMPLQAQPTAIFPVDYKLEEYHHSKEFHDSSSRRWPKPEVLALIKLRMGLDPKFREPGAKSLLWEEISAGMSRQGYSRPAKRCKEKWENINKYFKKAKENNKKRPEDAKTCPYFHHLDALYEDGVLGASHSSKQLLLERAEERSEHLVEQLNGSNTNEDSGQDSGQAQEGDSEILANIIPVAEENDPADMNTSNDIHFVLNPDSTSSGDVKVNIKESQILDCGSLIPPPATTNAASLSPNLDRIDSVKSISSSSKSMHNDPIEEKDMQFRM